MSSKFTPSILNHLTFTYSLFLVAFRFRSLFCLFFFFFIYFWHIPQQARCGDGRTLWAALTIVNGERLFFVFHCQKPVCPSGKLSIHSSHILQFIGGIFRNKLYLYEIYWVVNIFSLPIKAHSYFSGHRFIETAWNWLSSKTSLCRI